MLRFKGRLSQTLYNEELYALYDLFKNINYNNSADNSEPEADTSGAFWLKSDELYYAKNNSWHMLFKNNFQIINDLTSQEEPADPIFGQLWIDNGTLKHFNGSEFVPVKAATTEQTTNDFGFSNFLVVNNYEPYGRTISGSTEQIIQYHREIYPGDWLYDSVNELYYISIALSEHKLSPHFIPYLSYRISDGAGNNNTIVKVIDQNEYQINVDDNGLIYIYVAEPVKCFLNLFGTLNDVYNVTSINSKIKYLVPSTKLDKIFLNGLYTTNYETDNNVILSFDENIVSNRNMTLVHVNNSYLSDITQRLFYINKSSPYVHIPEEKDNAYTEYYAVYSNTHSKLLCKNAGAPEYTNIDNGISVDLDVFEDYDNIFILAITYTFNAFKTKGTLSRNKYILKNYSDGFAIALAGADKFLFFNNYFLNHKIIYNSGTGQFAISELPTNTQITIVDNVTQYNYEYPPRPDSNVSISKALLDVTLSDKNIIIFINGRVYTREDLTFDPINEQYLTGLVYSVYRNDDDELEYAIKVVDADAGFSQSMLVSSGTIDSTSKIHCSYADINQYEKYLLFINRVMIDGKNVFRSQLNGDLYSSEFSAGDKYVLIKEQQNNIVYSDKISTAIVSLPSSTYNIMYMDSNIVLDPGIVDLTTVDTNRQIRKSGDSYTFIEGGEEITLGEVPASVLDVLFSNYSSSGNNIEFLNSIYYNNKALSVLSYTYANSVEEPLTVGNITLVEDQLIYTLPNNHRYSPNTNSISIYIDGIKQYPGSYTEISQSEIALSDIVSGSNLCYIIENLEGSEIAAFKYQMLETPISGMTQSYQTAFSIYPGNLNVYVNGQRVPASSYTVNTPNVITINSLLKEYDKAYLEVRQDYTLREVTLPIKYDQITWNTADIAVDYEGIPGDGLPQNVISSSDFVLIYINGLLYGLGYTIDKINKTITLDSSAKNLFDPAKIDNGFITFVWR